MTETPITEKPFSINFTVYYAVNPPSLQTEGAPPLLLALHGWGQRCAPFIKSLSSLADRGILTLAPQGPHQFYVDAVNKKVGCNWLTAYQRDRSIEDANTYFTTLLQHIHDEHPYNPNRIYLMGFSQGVSMAYRFAVSGSIQPAGLIACGADIAPDVLDKLPQRTPFPVLLAHGKDDTLVPEIVLEANQTILREAHYPHEVYRYDGGHEITPGLCDKIADWISAH